MNEDTRQAWTPAERVGFRFLFTYIVLFFFPFPSGLVNPGWLGNRFDGLWERIVPWFARVFFGLSVTPVDNGSSDTPFDYARVAVMLALSAVITVVWTLLDRRRTNYRVLHAYTRVWLRYVLALCMLTYGASKVLMIQFEPPGYGRLIEPVGQLSPMALLWTFMGVSTFYTFFTGVAEVLGGLLLLSRRTTTLGALIVAGAMAQVAALNMAYDVPVKLGSLHILLLALVLIAPDLQRLLDFFVFNRATEPVTLGPQLPAGRSRVLMPWVKAAAILWALSYLSLDSWWTYRQHAAARSDNPTPPEGWYHIVSLSVDGKPVQPLSVGDFRWKTVSVAGGRVGVRTVDGSLKRFRAEGDPTHGLVLYPTDSSRAKVDTASVGSLKLSVRNNGQASLDGLFGGHAIHADAQRENPADFPLLSRGFRWVSDAPYFH